MSGRRGEGRAPREEERALPGENRQAAVRLARFMAPWRPMLAGTILLGLLSVGCDLAVPLAIERCVDSIGGIRGIHPDLSGLRTGLAAFAALFVLSAVLGYVQGLLSAVLSTHVEKDLRRALFDKLLRLPVERLERSRRGDLISRVYHDARLASAAFSEAMVALCCSVLVIVGCAAIMFRRCPELAAITVGASLLSALLTFFVSGALLPRFRAQQDALGGMNAHISESLGAFRSGTEGGRLDRDRRRMAEADRAYYAARMRVRRVEGLMEPLVLLLGNLTFLAVVARGADLALRDQIGLGTVQAFILYLKQFMEPVNGLAECWIELQSALSGAGRIFAVLDGESEESTLALPPPENGREDGPVPFLRLEDVRFGYRRNLPVLKGLDLTAEKGAHIAIVGRTGVGKTTVFNLLERFYQQYTGRIELEGREIRQIPLEELRRRVMWVPQDPQLLRGTVSRNIAYGVEGASPEDIRTAAERVGIARAIEALPQGYDTELDPDSPVFSQGQLQLVCLARAVLRDCDLLLLDEATSSLDTASEARLQRALEEMTRGRTCITVAHRLSTVARSDLICVLEDGAVCEAGTHDQLMARKGAYHELYMSQYWGRMI